MTMVLTTSAAVDLTIQNCNLVQTVAPAANSKFITLAGASRFKCLNNFFDVALTNHTGSTILGGTAASIDCEIRDNIFKIAGGATILSAVLLFAASTGVMARNVCVGTAAALAGLNNPANCYCVENYAENAVAKNGVLDPVITVSDLRLKTGVMYL